MTQENLVGYIEAEVAKGISRRDITNSLLAHGWSAHEIEEAYTKALVRIAHPVPGRRWHLPLLALALLLLVLFFFFAEKAELLGR